MSVHRRLYSLARDVHGFLPSLALLSFLTTAVIVFQMYLLSVIINDVFMLHKAPANPLLYMMAGAIFTRALLIWLRERLAQQKAVKIKSGLRLRLVEHLLKQGPSFSREQKTGELVNLLTEGGEKLDDYYTKYIPSIIHIAVLPVVIIAFAFYTDWLSGLIMLLTAPLILFFMWLIGTWARNLTNKQWQEMSAMSAHFLDVLQGIKTLKIFNRNNAEAEAVTVVSNDFRAITMKVLKVAFLSGMVLELAASISIAMVALQVGIRLIEGMMEYQVGLFILLLTPEFYLPFRSLGQHHHTGMEGASAAEKIFEMMDSGSQHIEPGSQQIDAGSQQIEPESKHIEPGSQQIEHGSQQNEPGSQQNEPRSQHIESETQQIKPRSQQIDDGLQQIDPGQQIEPGSQQIESGSQQVEPGPEANLSEDRLSVDFLNVDFYYPNATQPALKQISCSIEPGKLTAVVGRTGSGKTTFSFLLMGFLNPTSGQILFNGIPIDQIHEDERNRIIAYVSQHPHFFNMSVLENLMLANARANMEQVMEACTKAWAHEFIVSLPQGYHTQLTENAARLSGGEKQRLAIARAFLKNAPLLVLDEPTSNLDPESEELIARATEELVKNRTTLIIAHRLKTIYRAGKIMVFDDGQISETGTHDSLIAKKGIYAGYMQTHGNGGGL